MIIPQPQIRLILQGKKTQERLIVDAERCAYKRGHAYSIRSDFRKPTAARIIVSDVVEQQLGAITFEDARAEGFKTTADYLEHWCELHGPDLDRMVWRVSFSLFADEPRLLLPAESISPSHPRGYTNNPARAMRDEPEALSDNDLERLDEIRRRHWQIARSEELTRKRRRSLGIRFKEAMRRGDMSLAREIWLECEQLERDAA